jgi:CheY-like chemotaxis protein
MVTSSTPALLKGATMALQPPVKILLIDDEPGFVSGLAGLLRRDGYTVDTAGNGQCALEQLQQQHYDLLLCDLRMPQLSGSDFYDIVLRQYPSLRQRVIFLTGDTLGAESTAFLQQCDQPWLPKPCNAAAVRSAIQQALHAAPVATGA